MHGTQAGLQFIDSGASAQALGAAVCASRSARNVEAPRPPSQDDPPGAAAGAAARAPPPCRTPRLLIVDDDTAAIHVLHQTLAAVGDLHFAATGAEALQLARQLLPDLILLDAHMPGIDGFEVYRALKAEPAFSHLPIAFVSGHADPRYETRALELGAADFIAKPYSPAVLRARVCNLLELKRRGDAELQAVVDGRQRGDARLADIVDAASDAIVSFDAAGQIVLVNAAACRLLGVAPQQALGAAVAALLGDAIAAAVAAPTAIPWRDPWREPRPATLTLADGSQVTVEMSQSAAGAGRERLTTLLLRDTRGRERLEFESRSRIAAETASQMKSLMMASFAHEMGNPLHGLLGFAKLMATDPGHPLPAAQATRLAHIVTSGLSLQLLMRDVMELGCGGSGFLAVATKPVAVAGIAALTLDAVAIAASAAGVTLSGTAAACDLCVAADARRLQQCLVNLMTNAIKYNRPGGWVRLDAVAAGGQVAISICDNGIGIDAQQQAHLFEPFNRLGRELTAAPGAGLGLVITRQLVQAMKGRLQVDSTPAQGSCFGIVLPAAAPVAAGADAAADATAPAR